MRLLLSISSCLIFLSVSARADTLINAMGSTATAVNPYAGEAFVLASGGPFTDITFSFYTTSGAFALGKGYLFTRAYSGTPADLGSATDFLVGTATATGAAYVFDPALALYAGQYYFFYEDAYITPDTLLGGGNNYPETSGLAFFAATSTARYTAAAPLDFRVTGTNAITPEPSSFALLSTGILGVIGLVRTNSSRRNSKATARTRFRGSLSA